MAVVPFGDEDNLTVLVRGELATMHEWSQQVDSNVPRYRVEYEED